MKIAIFGRIAPIEFGHDDEKNSKSKCLTTPAPSAADGIVAFLDGDDEWADADPDPYLYPCLASLKDSKIGKNWFGTGVKVVTVAPEFIEDSFRQAERSSLDEKYVIMFVTSSLVFLSSAVSIEVTVHDDKISKNSIL